VRHVILDQACTGTHIHNYFSYYLSLGYLGVDTVVSFVGGIVYMHLIHILVI